MPNFRQPEDEVPNSWYGFHGGSSYDHNDEEEICDMNSCKPSFAPFGPSYLPYRVTAIEAKTKKALLIRINQGALAWVPKSLVKGTKYKTQVKEKKCLRINHIWNAKAQVADYKRRCEPSLGTIAYDPETATFGPLF